MHQADQWMTQQSRDKDGYRDDHDTIASPTSILPRCPRTAMLKRIGKTRIRPTHLLGEGLQPLTFIPVLHRFPCTPPPKHEGHRRWMDMPTRLPGAPTQQRTGRRRNGRRSKPDPGAPVSQRMVPESR